MRLGMIARPSKRMAQRDLCAEFTAVDFIIMAASTKKKRPRHSKTARPFQSIG
jgi:hypothetical protein